MPDWISTDMNALMQVLVSTFLSFSMLVIFVRISGLRSFAKMTAIDFASTIAIGSVLASTILSSNPSIVKGGAAIALILIFQTLFSNLIVRSDRFENMVTNKPIFLMEGENIIFENLAQTNMTQEQLMAKLREANVLKLSQVKYVVLETTGDISVLHSDDNTQVDEIILQGVGV